MPGFGSVGVWEVILILAVLLLVFGAKRLPEIGAALGKGIREFKGSVRDIENEINRPADRPSANRPPAERPQGELPRSEAPAPESSRSEEPQPSEVDTTRPDPDRQSRAE